MISDALLATVASTGSGAVRLEYVVLLDKGVLALEDDLVVAIDAAGLSATLDALPTLGPLLVTLHSPDPTGLAPL